MLILHAILTCLMLAVILNDTTRYLIPNWLVLALVIIYPFSVWIAHGQQDWRMACLVALGMFAAGYVLFSMKLVGGGDIKLLTATALYAGKETFFDYMILVTMLGGLLAITLLLLRPAVRYAFGALKKSAYLPRVLTPGEKYFPYGVAIAAAFLWMLWRNQFPGLVL